MTTKSISRIRHFDLSPVYVWEAPVRLTHWLIVLSMVVLGVSGVYIGNPFLVANGEAGDHFIMGWARAVHFYFAIVFVLAVLSRILWMFMGNRWSRWKQFLPVQKRRREGLIGTLKFYLFARETPPPFIGHNPLAGMAYTLVFVLYLVMITTGLGLYAVNAHVGSPMRGFEFFVRLFGGMQSARYIHHICMWLLFGFAAHHVWSGFLVSRVEKMGTMDSIFSGYKFVHAEDVKHLAKEEGFE